MSRILHRALDLLVGIPFVALGVWWVWFGLVSTLVCEITGNIGVGGPVFIPFGLGFIFFGWRFIFRKGNRCEIDESPNGAGFEYRLKS